MGNNHDNSRGMFVGIICDTGNKIIVDISNTEPNIIDEQGMVHVWHRLLFGLPPVSHTEPPLEDDIPGERRWVNLDNVWHTIFFDKICEQYATIKLFPTASPPPEPPPPEPPPHRC